MSRLLFMAVAVTVAMLASVSSAQMIPRDQAELFTGCARADADKEFVAGKCKITSPRKRCYDCIASACSADCTTHCQDRCDGLLFAALGMEELLGWMTADELSMAVLESGYLELDAEITFEEADFISAFAARTSSLDVERYARVTASGMLWSIMHDEAFADADTVTLLEDTVLRGLESRHWKARYSAYTLLLESQLLSSYDNILTVVELLAGENNARVSEHGRECLIEWYLSGR